MKYYITKCVGAAKAVPRKDTALNAYIWKEVLQCMTKNTK